jgi:hypothetical protein
VNVYDELGTGHPVLFAFTPDIRVNFWHWKASVFGADKIIQGSNGILRFGQDGSVASFNYDGSDSILEIEPGNNLKKMALQLFVWNGLDFLGKKGLPFLPYEANRNSCT